jgi:large subunit ribosomal protein L24e
MNCSFCKNELEKGTGKMFVKLDGRIFYYCSSKCQKNSRIRDPKNIVWVTKKKKTKEKTDKK